MDYPLGGSSQPGDEVRAHGMSLRWFQQQRGVLKGAQCPERPASWSRPAPRQATRLEPQANFCHGSGPGRAPGAQVGTVLALKIDVTACPLTQGKSWVEVPEMLNYSLGL